MRYEIQSKNDLSSGAMLTVRFPEEDLDRKALYTLQSDWPEFLLPFRYRSVDGAVECTYQLGSHIRLQYRCGERTPEEAIQFWGRVFRPLLDCSDWFLKPLSFVLDPQYLYTDRTGDMIWYLYVPSRQACVEEDALQKMAVELSRQNPVRDPALENQVLRAIMQDFQPKTFLQMLEASRHTAPAQRLKPEAPPAAPEPAEFHIRPETPEDAKPAFPVENSLGDSGDLGDIVIQMDGEKTNKKKKGHGLFGGKKAKKEPEKDSARKGSLFGRKKEKASKEIFLGAAAEEAEKPTPREQVYRPPVSVMPELEDGVTQLEDMAGGTRLRLVGDPSLPREIPVDLAPGQTFTVGRFDVSVGHRQSSFEFDKRTKAVSRHHAAIEREPDGAYTIVDLVSSAGTFLDSQRMTPNVPYALTPGCRISFGTGGADYIWEESSYGKGSDPVWP